ncbi:topoisomerase DNA-binding C4 zinc finger domain-containing protein [Domibacillus aminovorans]
MIKWTNKEGKQFWGCSYYPKCRNTKNKTSFRYVTENRIINNCKPRKNLA